MRNVLTHILGILGLKPSIKRCLRKFNYRRNVRISGRKISIPTILGAKLHITETWMVELLARLLPEHAGVFLDVGVNVGQTLVKVKAIDPQREYIGFEPNPFCALYVSELVNDNKFQKCTIVPVGLYTENSVIRLSFFSDDKTDSMASVVDGFRPAMKVHSRIFVPVFQFDNLIGILDMKKAGIVKIDVEGSELEVIKSLSTLIKRDRPTIIIELLPLYQGEDVLRKNRQEELKSIMDGYDYVTFRIEKNMYDGYSGLKGITKIEMHSDLALSDYLMIPAEQIGRLKDPLDLPVDNSVHQDGQGIQTVSNG